VFMTIARMNKGSVEGTAHADITHFRNSTCVLARVIIISPHSVQLANTILQWSLDALSARLDMTLKHNAINARLEGTKRLDAHSVYLGSTRLRIAQRA